MKLKLILVFAFISTGLLNAQNLKTFKGELNIGEITPANVTYTYYEDSKTLEFVKQGAYKFTYSFTSLGGSYNATFNGSFKKNKKDGVWVFLINETNCPHSDNLFYTGFTKLTASYSNGVPNGIWNYSCQLKRHEKKWNNTWGTYETLPSELVTATFKDGHFIGQLSLKNNPSFSEYSNISGIFDDKGNPTGKWVLQNSKSVLEYEFQNGLLLREISREISSGKVLSNTNDNEEMKKIKNDFSQNKLSRENLDSLKITVYTTPLVGERAESGLLWFDESFNNKIFKHEYIGGDITNNENSKYGFMTTLNKAKLLALNDIEGFKFAEDYYNSGDFKVAKERYKILLMAYEDNLPKAESQLLLDRIKKCDKGNINDEKIELAKKKYHNATLNFNYVKSWDAPYTFIAYVKEAYNSYSDLLTNYKEFPTEQHISESTENLNKCSDYIQKAERELLIIERIKTAKQKIKSNKDDLITAFGIIVNMYGETTKIQIKEKLYNVYIEIYNDLNSRFNSSTLPNDELIYIDKIVALQAKMITLANNDSKAIEKQLKNATSITEKMQILGI